MDICIDNVFEWTTGDKIGTVTFSQRKWVNKLKKLAEDNPDIEIVAENDDGSICAHVPIGYFKFSPPKKREMTEEERAAAAERLKAARERKKSNE